MIADLGAPLRAVAQLSFGYNASVREVYRARYSSVVVRVA